MRIFILLIFVIIQGVVLANELGMKMDTGLIVKLLAFLLIALIGNYMNTFRPNWFIGIKTPWTLSNDEVWRKTHRLSGKIWFWCGLAGIAASFISQETVFVYFSVFLLVLMVVVPVAYSYIEYKKLQS